MLVTPARFAVPTLLLAATLATGCKTPIPAEFENFVPTEHRDKVSLATKTEGSSYGADEMLIITYDAGIGDPELDAAYAEQIEAAGFTALSECKAEGAPVSRDFIKAPAEHVQVFFRTAGSAEVGPMLHVFHTAKVRELGGGQGCTFTEAAKTMCKTLEGGRCVLPE